MAKRKIKKKRNAGKSPKYDLLRLENQLCFALYAATSVMTRTYMIKLAPMGITYPQYLVLLVLWEQDGVSMSEIGQRLMLGTGTLTPLVKRLEAQNIVQRERDEDDERVVRIWLSPQGLDLRDEALEARLFVACSLGMNEKEILRLRSELMDMVEHLATRCSDDVVE